MLETAEDFISTFDRLPITEQVEVAKVILRRNLDVEPETIFDEFAQTEWQQSITRNPTFEFLKDPAEDIYSLEDGKPLNDEE